MCMCVLTDIPFWRKKNTYLKSKKERLFCSTHSFLQKTHWVYIVDTKLFSQTLSFNRIKMVSVDQKTDVVLVYQKSLNRIRWQCNGPLTENSFCMLGLLHSKYSYYNDCFFKWRRYKYLATFPSRYLFCFLSSFPFLMFPLTHFLGWARLMLYSSISAREGKIFSGPTKNGFIFLTHLCA